MMESKTTYGRKVIFLCRSGRGKLLKEVDEGREPEDFFYGFFARLKSGDGELLEIHESRNRVAVVLNSFFQRLFGQNFHVFTVWSQIWGVSRRDILFTNIDSIALPLAFLKFLGLLNSKILHISQGLTNSIERLQKSTLFAEMGRQFLSILAKEIDDLCVLGEGACGSMTSLLKTSPFCLQFGVDEAFWKNNVGTERESNDSYILTVGSDSNRDFEVLKRCESPYLIKVVTRLDIGELPPHMKKCDCSNAIELRELIKNARLLIVSLQDISQPSGQSSALQAMAMSKPVVLSDTKGLWDRKNLVDGFNLKLVEPFNEKAINSAICDLLKDSSLYLNIATNARRTIERHYTNKMMSDRLNGRFELLHSSQRKQLV